MKHGMKCMKGGFMMPCKLKMHAEELGIGEDKISKIHDIFTNMRKQKVKIKSEISLLEIDLHNLIMQEQVNMPDVEQKIREIAKLKADKKIAWIQAMQDMRNVLTPEQQKNIKKMIMSFWKMKMGGMGSKGGMYIEEEEEVEEEEGEEEEEE